MDAVARNRLTVVPRAAEGKADVVAGKEGLELELDDALGDFGGEAHLGDVGEVAAAAVAAGAARSAAVAAPAALRELLREARQRCREAAVVIAAAWRRGARAPAATACTVR